MRIRKAKPRDLDRLLELYRLLKGPYSEVETLDSEAGDLFTRVLLDPDQTTLVAEDYGEIVGSLVRGPRPEPGPRGRALRAGRERRGGPEDSRGEEDRAGLDARGNGSRPPGRRVQARVHDEPPKIRGPRVQRGAGVWKRRTSGSRLRRERVSVERAGAGGRGPGEGSRPRLRALLFVHRPKLPDEHM